MFSSQLANRACLPLFPNAGGAAIAISASVPEFQRRRHLCLRLPDPDDASRHSRGRASASEFFRKP
jgi:hypothetical protein